jgi:hypothetical protein
MVVRTTSGAMTYDRRPRRLWVARWPVRISHAWVTSSTAQAVIASPWAWKWYEGWPPSREKYDGQNATTMARAKAPNSQ